MKYWTYLGGSVPGAFEPLELAKLPGFGMGSLVCPAEGEIEEKNWRRAGEFEELARAVSARAFSSPPSPPLGAAFAGAGPDALLDAASVRLFAHVSELMHELETRRGEKALVQALQRQLQAAKDELERLRPALAEKERSLAKSLSVIRRLEEQLSRLFPSSETPPPSLPADAESAAAPPPLESLAVPPLD